MSKQMNEMFCSCILHRYLNYLGIDIKIYKNSTILDLSTYHLFSLQQIENVVDLLR